MTGLRIAGAGIALAIVALWIRFLQNVFAGAAGTPAPGAFLVPAIFSCLAVAGGVAALRREGVVVVVAGALSFVPVGLYLTLFGGAPRWIGVLDLALAAVGILMVRAEPREGDGRGGDEEAGEIG